MRGEVRRLSKEGLERFHSLGPEAVSAVTERLYAIYKPVYAQYGSRGKEACHETLATHLELLKRVLEFGQLHHMTNYLVWLTDLLDLYAIPERHLSTSLDWLDEFFVEHMSPEDSEVVGDALRTARSEFLGLNKLPIAASISIESWPEAIPFEEAILIGDHGAAMAIMNQLLDGSHKLPEIERYMVQPALYGIREKWQSNLITLVCEQMATAIVKSVLIAAMLRSPASPQNGKRVLLGCTEGNVHDIELRIVADTFLIEGWEVRCLGASVPTQELLDQAIEWRPDLVVLSVSLMPQLLTVNATITQLNERLGSERPSVMISGLAISHYGRLASIIVGADSWSTDARGAIHCANLLKLKESPCSQKSEPWPAIVDRYRSLSSTKSSSTASYSPV